MDGGTRNEDGLTDYETKPRRAGERGRGGKKDHKITAQNIQQRATHRHPVGDDIEEIDRLARAAATALCALIDASPATAFGLIREAAFSLPDYPRPTGWPGKFTPRDIAKMLADETVEEITNWADVATQFDLTVAAIASLQRLRPALRRRVVREVPHEGH
jgi:hypothetical protein